MKMFLILLFAPLISLGQTVHTKDGRIFYEGKEKTESTSPSQIMSSLQQALATQVRNYEKIETTDGTLKAKGRFRLNTPHKLVRTADYIITLKPVANGYEYTIDSVSLTERKRGQSVTHISSEKLLERMEDYGIEAMNTERILNEIDLRIQHLLVMLRKSASGDAIAVL